MQADMTVVQHDTAKPLLALLRDRNGVIDLSVPTAITLHLTQADGTVLSAACTVADWPELVDGQTVQCASYDWSGGGNATGGVYLRAEWELTYAEQPVTVPSRRPAVIYVRPELDGTPAA